MATQTNRPSQQPDNCKTGIIIKDITLSGKDINNDNPDDSAERIKVPSNSPYRFLYEMPRRPSPNTP
jgi:hypothetical protein